MLARWHLKPWLIEMTLALQVLVHYKWPRCKSLDLYSIVQGCMINSMRGGSGAASLLHHRLWGKPRGSEQVQGLWDNTGRVQSLHHSIGLGCLLLLLTVDEPVSVVTAECCSAYWSESLRDDVGSSPQEIFGFFTFGLFSHCFAKKLTFNAVLIPGRQMFVTWWWVQLSKLSQVILVGMEMSGVY